ncbi:unnamed protein product [Spirodela intermedia]|uniref:Uncharacterized protein n=2 Tax=Spirodela intermedia TaxID=51605 RepID=A0A7I8L9R3_SPIIN|nr:unnamed protein product [Spirodela intermedia]CAA6669061.1 unnamed protein product [Spirodela intermedia]CAA7406008.1 unnamed protein product [Spirodela intermedia]
MVRSGARHCWITGGRTLSLSLPVLFLDL